MASIALGSDKLALDLDFRREGVHIARVVRHEVLLALAASHVHSDDSLWPRDGVA